MFSAALQTFCRRMAEDVFFVEGGLRSDCGQYGSFTDLSAVCLWFPAVSAVVEPHIKPHDRERGITHIRLRLYQSFFIITKYRKIMFLSIWNRTNPYVRPTSLHVVVRAI